MKISRALLVFSGAMILALSTVPAYANLTIVPTFAANITGDPNAAAIEGTINSAIATYESLFTDPITVSITFQEGGGLGGSSFFLYSFDYTTFYNALVADGKSADDATAIAHIAAGPNNPVTGTSTVLMKAANAHAIGLSCAAQGCGATEGGTITLNTSLTTPGSPGSSLTYNLLPVVEHEIDEILGLGSTLGLGLNAPFNNDPSPEDFFRYTNTGARSFTTTPSNNVFFSIDGTTDLAQFDNQNDGGDFGDWQSNPHMNGAGVQVQDAFATPGANPALGVEIRALDVIGYDLATHVNTPEPDSLALLASGLVLIGGFVRFRMSK